MSITLYTAPDCLRCKIVKSWLQEKGISYNTVDFKEDSATFNAFYRAKRPQIYRNPEGVEFPLFDDGAVVKQGSGEIIAYQLAGHDLECCVTRSDLLHGWISGLYPSRCPAALFEKFEQLTRRLAQGGLQVCLRVDGRNPDLLEKIVNLAGKVEMEIPVSGNYVGESSPSSADLAKTIEIMSRAASSEIRLIIDPIQTPEAWQWPDRAAVALAAKNLAEAAQNKQLPCFLAPFGGSLPKGLEPLPAQNMLKFRSAAREFLFKIENAPVV